eukprot:693885-Rhodomonas_salina.1
MQHRAQLTHSAQRTEDRGQRTEDRGQRTSRACRRSLVSTLPQALPSPQNNQPACQCTSAVTASGVGLSALPADSLFSIPAIPPPSLLSARVRALPHLLSEAGRNKHALGANFETVTLRTRRTQCHAAPGLGYKPEPEDLHHCIAEPEGLLVGSQARWRSSAGACLGSNCPAHRDAQIDSAGNLNHAGNSPRSLPSRAKADASLSLPAGLRESGTVTAAELGCRRRAAAAAAQFSESGSGSRCQGATTGEPEGPGAAAAAQPEAAAAPGPPQAQSPSPPSCPCPPPQAPTRSPPAKSCDLSRDYSRSRAG